ncbi:hypothetical protein BC952_1818 [Flavobacterium limicola]|uniref:Ig-like domain-containing protein n=2 Tax=Flavobacterium limicola TaxID=180441 RepID=A0A495S2Z5_9FLAO|nr:hypothetical protein BC952_1818 [Flavobacterium limicola]
MVRIPCLQMTEFNLIILLMNSFQYRYIMGFYKKIVLFFLIFASFDVYSQNTLDNLGLTSATPAAGAYSLRKLSSSYLDSAIQVRRSTDNTTQNIGFDSNGNLDANSLTSFVGSGDGFLTIWYDQSGNGNNAIQNALLNQPKIITTGVIERSNGFPTIIFSGSQFLVVNSTVFNNDLTGCLVYNASSFNNRSGLARSWFTMNGIFGSEQPGGTTDFAYGIYNNKFTAGNGPSDNSIAGNTTVNDNSIRLHSWTRNRITGQINLYANGAIDGTANLNTGTFSAVTSVAIGANQTFTGGQVFYNGNVSELILFPTVLTNPRQTIEYKQGLYYSVCTLATQPSSNNQSVILGGTPTSLGVLSSDPDATYQWYSNTVKSNTGGTILPGETNTSYTPSTAAEGTLYYYAVISSATTTCASNVSGYVRVGIEITSQPSNSNQTVIQNSSANSLNVTATGSSITYQWYKNLNNSNTGGTLINGATTNSYTPLSTDLGTSYYYVVVSGNNTILVSNPSGAIKITTIPVIWNGPKITFEKSTGSDWMLPENQDYLTDKVTITRAYSGGLFNITQESNYNNNNISPLATEWSKGTMADFGSLTFSNWRDAMFSEGMDYCLPCNVGQDFVLHLIEDNIYIDLKLVSWVAGGGGGFSYERSTPNPYSPALLSGFNPLSKTLYDGSFTITPPNTDSTGAFSYVSSDTNVARISGTTVTIVAAGVSTITATQDADATHLSNTISADLNINAVTVVTKNGEITNIKPNYVNKNGANGTSSGVGVNGEIKLTKTSSITLFTQVTIPFEEYFDLEAGSLCGGSCFDIVTSNYDLVFAAGGGTVRARMWWNNQYTDMAMVYDKSFDNLTSADIANYYYCDYIGDPNLSCFNVDTPPTDFVGIYHTNSGNYYAVQYLSEDTSGVTFKYKRLN